MKKSILIVVTVVTLIALLAGTSVAMAAKPPKNGAGKNVIELSNGFPSGFHFNLNIHGKDPLTFTCPTDSGGNSIFIPESTEDYDPINIEMVSNKKAHVYELTVLDACAMPTELGGDSLARVQLPYKIQPDELGPVIDANGYYVYARILGKPNNSKKDDGASSNITLTPSPVLRVCNDLGDPDFPTYTDCNDSFLVLGLVTSNGAYKATDAGFVRFDTSSDSQGKGKSKAQNITDLFMWTGWVCDDSLDTNGDGVIDENDVPADQDEDGDIDADDLQLWLEAKATEGLARYYEDWWVFDIADLVVQTWDVDNDGTKLIQIRFYPVATTEFAEMAHIVVKKITDPLDDTTTLFDFEATYRNPWQMTSDQFCPSHGLEAGYYEVTELAEDGWNLTDILIQDPTGDSSVVDSKACINLAEGETVTVTFTNTYAAP